MSQPGNRGTRNWNTGCFLLENIEHRISGIWNVGNWKLGICKLENQVFFNAKHRICGMQNVENGKSMDKMCWFIYWFSITCLTYEMYIEKMYLFNLHTILLQVMNGYWFLILICQLVCLHRIVLYSYNYLDKALQLFLLSFI